MGDITLGTVILTRVLEYRISDVSTIGKKRIPAKTTPTVDTDVKTLMPTEFTIVARVSGADRNTLHGYKASSQTLTDDDGSKTVWVEDVNSEYDVGAKLPWMTTINCTQTVY